MRLIRPIALPLPAFEPLLKEARAEAVDFVEMTARLWENGTNRFDGPGEVFCGCYEGEELIAIGGLTVDPYVSQQEALGRLRRIYVRSAWRNQGVGTSMVLHLLGQARQSFRGVRLRADNAGAARLYERLGFVAITSANATHLLRF